METDGETCEEAKPGSESQSTPAIPVSIKVEEASGDDELTAASNEADTESYKIQVESLEKTSAQLRSEVERLQCAMKQQDEASSKKFQQLTQHYDSKIERLQQQCAQATKDRDNMVMKYAESEKGVFTLQRQMQQVETRVKQLAKEKEALEGKIKALTNDKVKMSQTIDAKNTDVANLEKEIQKGKDVLYRQSDDLKFFQNKLKQELESHKETQAKLEKANQRFREAKEETEQVRRDAQEMMRSCEPPDEDFRLKHNQLLDEFNQICVKVQHLELERLDYEQTVSRYKQQANQQQENLLDLQASRAELESTRLLLQREKERVVSSVAEADSLRQTNQDLQAEAESCRQREAELLTFTQKLTERNVTVQAELTAAQARTAQLDFDYAACQRKRLVLEEETAALNEELPRVKQQRLEEKELLERHLAEQTSTAERLSQRLEDQIGENQLLKKKHLATLKELTRELQGWRKRGGDLLDSAPLSHGSSSTSLDTAEHRSSDTEPRVPEPLEPDRQRLIEKVVAVQRSNARKQEKIEFLEEHTNQLTLELQRKTRLVQALVLKQPPAALTTTAVDQNKADLAKHGGIMASLYNSKPVDDNMTLELSLEINQKLQAALEDTLLKNITLKENLETLGNEIARLAKSTAPGRPVT